MKNIFARKSFKKVFWKATVLYVLFLISAVYTAYKFDKMGFLEVDSCWILALGKIIWQTGSVPTSDPFSFTIPLASAVGMPQPFLVHQWLFDWLCYALFHTGKLMLVAAFCAAISALTYITIPLRICLRANLAPLAIYTITICTAATALLRPFVRPENCSCFCLAVWLLLLQSLRQGAEVVTVSGTNTRISYKLIGAFTLVMLLWCNMHTGFLAGLAVLGVVAASFAAQDLIVNKRFSGPTQTSMLALACSLLVTLVNPAGLKLWQFLPTLFGLGQYFFILEMQTIEAKNFSDLSFTPFFVMVAVSLAAVVFYFRQQSKKSGHLLLLSPLRLGSVALIAAAVYASFHVWRMIPFSILILALECATLFSRSKPGVVRSLWGPSPLDIVFKASSTTSRSFACLFDVLPAVTAALSVALLANRITVLSLPQLSKNFTPPVRAIQFLMQHPQSGPLFNEALIGSMLTWYLPNVKIFVDTRFDEYGRGILSDYQTVLYLQKSAPAVLSTYGIEWIFIESNQPLAEALKKAPGWKIIYADEDAYIFRRVQKQADRLNGAANQ